VALTYNPSYLEGRDHEDHSSRPAQANRSQDPPTQPTAGVGHEPVIPAMVRSIKQEDWGPGWSVQKIRPYLKNNQSKKQLACLPSKQALSSNPLLSKKKENFFKEVFFFPSSFCHRKVSTKARKQRLGTCQAECWHGSRYNHQRWILYVLAGWPGAKWQRRHPRITPWSQ
jgi:hypothetical protein